MVREHLIKMFTKTCSKIRTYNFDVNFISQIMEASFHRLNKI